MKLGLLLGYSGSRVELPLPLIQQAEAAGFDSVWVAEAYGSDAVSVAAWVLAQTQTLCVGTGIMQAPARTPAMTAMSAMSLAQLSNNRFILGLGASGPQVVEGWHGQAYNEPIQRMREYIDIVRMIMARQQPAAYDGKHYQLPYRGANSLGLGKPLKSILSATTTPVYTASFTPAGFRLAGEVADGLFPAFASPSKLGLITESVEQGFAKASSPKDWHSFDIAPFVEVYCSDNRAEYEHSSREMLALYIGGMGAVNKNFYAAMACRMGYEEETKTIQSLFLSGDRKGAYDAVPSALIDELSLTGTREHIAAKAQKWKQAHADGYVDTLILNIKQPEMLEYMVTLFK